MTHPPITPPPELVDQWRNLPEYTDGRRKIIMVTVSREKLLDIANQAARWGADQELEACCEWLASRPGNWESTAQELADDIRAARRPKPPSLKEQANSISFQKGSEVIRIDAKGFHYYGQFIEDAGEAHRLLVEFLRKHQPDSDWHHAK